MSYKIDTAGISAPDEFVVTGSGGNGYATIEDAITEINTVGGWTFAAPARITLLTRSVTVSSTITVPQYVSIRGENCRVNVTAASGSAFSLSGYNRVYGLEFISSSNNTDFCFDCGNNTDISIIECHLYGGVSNPMRFLKVEGATWARINAERCLINYYGTSNYAFFLHNTGVTSRFCDSWFENIFTDAYQLTGFGGNFYTEDTKDIRIKRCTIRGDTSFYTGLRLSGGADLVIVNQCNFDAAPGGTQLGYDIYTAVGTVINIGVDSTAKRTLYDGTKTVLASA